LGLTFVFVLAIIGAVAAENSTDTSSDISDLEPVDTKESSDVTISGLVKRCSDGTPFSGVTVTVSGDGENIASTTSNGEGYYSLNFNHNLESYHVTATASGHKISSQQVTVNTDSENRKTATADFTLGVGDTYVYGGWGTNPDEMITFPDGTTINKSAPATYTTINDGIINVDIGKTVYVGDWTYYEGITIYNNLNLVGQSQNGTKIDGSDSVRPVTVSSGTVTITNFTIQNGRSITGGGIANSGNLIIFNTTIKNNTAFSTGISAYSDGGGIYNYDIGIMNITGCTIENNTASASAIADAHSWGGGICNWGNLEINYTTIQNNRVIATGPNVYTYGGGISNHDNLTIRNSVINNNNAKSEANTGTAAVNGGGIFNSNILEIYDTLISNNIAESVSTGGIAGSYGGGIMNFGDNLIIKRSTIENNNAQATGNLATAQGGGIYSFGMFTANYNRIAGNYPHEIHNAASITPDVKYNWWSSNNPIFTNLVVGSLDYTPWLFMTIEAQPATIYNGDTSLIKASFNNYFDGTILTPFNPEVGHIPDGTIVTFDTDKGNIGSNTIEKETNGGIAIATLTANETPGVAHVNAATDFETRNVDVIINPSPIASFTATPTSGKGPLKVKFTSTSIGTINRYEWDFDGDGKIDSTAQNPTYTYTKQGVYTVLLTVKGPGGTSIKIRTNYITVRMPDLLMQSVYAPTTARRGRYIRVTNRVRNIGNWPSGSFYVAFYLKRYKNSSKKYYLGRRYVSSLKASISSFRRNYFRVSYKIPRGRYYILAVADYTRRVKESLRANNIKYTTTRTRII